MKHVVFFTAPGMDFSPATLSAVPVVIRGLALAAQRDGLDVTVVSSYSANPLFSDIKTIPVNFTPAPKAGLSLLCRRIERKILQYQRILHRRWVAESIAALSKACPPGGTIVFPAELEFDFAIAAGLPDRQIIVLFHDCNFSCKSRFLTKIQKSHLIFCGVSRFCSEGAEKYFGLAQNSVHTVYNAVDHSLFTPKAGGQSTIPTITFHGRGVREKGIDILLAAALKLAQAGMRFNLQIAGANRGLELDLSDPYQQELTVIIEHLAKAGISVRRHGNVPFVEIPDYLRRADIHVCPYRWDEPFGMATLEGMACGLATVASNTGGTPEVVGDAGLLFDRENVNQLAAHLELLISKPDLRADLGHRASERSKLFTWDHSWRALRAITEDISPKH
jgi:glycosyltransferase involved in cell wall biosynthesis